MNIRMSMDDFETGRDASVGQSGLEYLGDVGEVFLTFLHATGYSYVKQIVIVKDDNSEVSTQL
jgi:hypothetical protein